MVGDLKGDSHPREHDTETTTTIHEHPADAYIEGTYDSKIHSSKLENIANKAGWHFIEHILCINFSRRLTQHHLLYLPRRNGRKEWKEAESEANSFLSTLTRDQVRVGTRRWCNAPLESAELGAYCCNVCWPNLFCPSFGTWTPISMDVGRRPRQFSSLSLAAYSHQHEENHQFFIFIS
ncbi:hypothetical protein Dimus_037967 [Dionaea muscipula]